MLRKRFTPAVVATMVAGMMTAAGAWAMDGPSRPSMSPAPASQTNLSSTSAPRDDAPELEVEHPAEHEPAPQASPRADVAEDMHEQRNATAPAPVVAPGAPTAPTVTADDHGAGEHENEPAEIENENAVEHQGEVESGDDNRGPGSASTTPTTTMTSSGRDGSGTSGSTGTSGSGRDGGSDRSGRDGSGDR